MTFELRSPAFGPGEPIPVRHSGDGEDISPALEWSGAPAGTRELALICDDPDAPRAEPWVHWVVFGIPPDTTILPEDVRSWARGQRDLRQGVNDFGAIGYGGPAPPRGHGRHHYRFRLYAVAAKIDLPEGATKAQVLDAIRGRTLGLTELVGTYERAGPRTGARPRDERRTRGT